MKTFLKVMATTVLNVALATNLSVSKWLFYEPAMPERLMKKDK